MKLAKILKLWTKKIAWANLMLILLCQGSLVMSTSEMWSDYKLTVTDSNLVHALV